ncbi:MAG: DUF401 family protein [Dehalococcoidia bacterium]|nr:DUF401 family protein [Dehalococcoidia bacterium]
MSEFLRLILAFALILILIRRKVNIGLAMLVAAVFLGLLFQIAPLDIGQVAFRSAVDLSTLNLLASLILILFLENVMRKTLLLQRMVSAVTAVARDRRLAMALLPAFVGLLPSVGGAVFSAPMVEEASQGLGLSPERKSFINYWYRHLWEPVLPIYPSIIIISQLWKIPVGDVIAIMFPLTIAAMVAGIPLAFRGIETKTMRLATGDRRKVALDLASGLGPIVAVMVLVLLLNLDVWLALFLVIGALLLLYRYSFDQVVSLVREAFSLQIVLLVIGLMVFKGLLQQSSAIETLPPFMASYGIPVLGLAFILPFIVGVMTGMAQAPIAIVFPIIGALSVGGVDMRMLPFAFASGFAGVMLSPTHMCFVLTVRHFKADFGKVLRMVIVPEAAIVLVGAAIYLIR